MILDLFESRPSADQNLQNGYPVEIGKILPFFTPDGYPILDVLHQP